MSARPIWQRSGSLPHTEADAEDKQSGMQADDALADTDFDEFPSLYTWPTIIVALSLVAFAVLVSSLYPLGWLT